ncbi:MFS transporter [Novipirellula herctigrandis]|uniref:MFS transporter n=1 Tax=Novipirellula herctigrandis TaxID=2527986 RepID=UPI003AF3968A
MSSSEIPEAGSSADKTLKESLDKESLDNALSSNALSSNALSSNALGSSALSSNALSVGEKVGYGLGDTASNLYWKTFEFFLMYFYTDVFGLTAKSAGGMMLITRIWDAINDPIVGYLADRTRTAWGRFRPYLVWMSVPLAITGCLTFYTPDLSPSGKLAYAYVTYTLVMIAYTAINIPYGALMGVISSSSLERTSVSTYRFVAAFIGGIVVQYFTLDLVAIFGGGIDTMVVDGVEKGKVVNEQAGFFWTMVIFSMAAVILFLITFATTKERVQPESEAESTFRADLHFVLTSFKFHQIMLIGLTSLALLATALSPDTLYWILAGYLSLSVLALVVRFVALTVAGNDNHHSTFEQDFNDLLTNRPWMVLFGFGLMQLMGAFVRGGAILYYFKYYCGDAGYAPAFWVSGSFAAIAGMLLTKRLTSIFGKKKLMILMNIGVAVTTAVFILLGPEQIVWMFAFHIAASFIGGPSPVLLWAMYADAADYSEWKNHRRATGLLFSAATFSQKLGCAIGAAMTGFALDFYDYAPPIDGMDVTQSDHTKFGLCMMMSLIPAVFYVLAAACLVFYNISEPKQRQIESELQERRRQESNVVPEPS